VPAPFLEGAGRAAAMPTANAETQEYDYLFKMLLVGDPSVGKSSLLLRFIDDVYTGDYATTIGVDFKTRTTTIDDTRVKLQIWDTAGHERFRAITSGYYRGAHGVVIVYDVTSHSSFENIQYWADEVNKFAPAEVSKLLIGNKCDLDGERQVSTSEAERFADELGVVYIETSALSAHNVAEAFDRLCADIKIHVATRQSFIASRVATFSEDADGHSSSGSFGQLGQTPVVLGPSQRVHSLEVQRCGHCKRQGCCGR